MFYRHRTDRTTYQKMIFISVSFAVVALLLTVVINWLYPLSFERELARRPMFVWLIGYGSAIFLLSACVLMSSLLCTSQFPKSIRSATICAGAITFLILVAYCILVVNKFPEGFGIQMVDIMNAKFFAEWQHLKFLGVVSPACASLSAALTWIESRQFG